MGCKDKTFTMQLFPLIFIIFNVVFLATNCKALCLSGETSDITGVIMSSSFNGAPIIMYESSYGGRAAHMKLLDLNRTQLLYDQSSFLSFLEQHMMAVIRSSSLEEMKKSLHFVVLCNTSCIFDLLSKLSHLDKAIGQGSLLRHFSTWLIISLEDPQAIGSDLDNIAWVRLENEYMHCEDTNTRNAMEKCKGNYCSNYKDQFKETTVHTLLWTPGERQWSPVCWVNLSHQQLFEVLYPNSNRGLNGRKLQLLALEWEEFITKSVTNGTVTFEGATIEVTRILGKLFNFSFHVKEPRDGLWGIGLSNGSWTGMIGALQRSEADFVPIPYIMDTNRKAVVDFSPMVSASEYQIIYQRVIDDSYSWFYFLSCFKVEVYLCILASLLWSLLFGILVKRYLLKNQFTNCDVIDFGLRTLLRQGIVRYSENNVAKILTWTWCAFCLLTIVFFMANLVAFATVDKHQPPFSNLQELSKTDYKIYYFDGDPIETVFKISDDPSLRRIAERTVPMKLVDKVWGGLTYRRAAELLQEGRNAFVAATTSLQGIKSKSCDFDILQERILHIFASFPFQRQSPLLKMFQNKMQQLKDSGIIDKAIKMWTKAAKPCEPQQRSQSFPLDLLKPVLTVCAAAVIVAFLVLLMERWGKAYGLFSF